MVRSLRIRLAALAGALLTASTFAQTPATRPTTAPPAPTGPTSLPVVRFRDVAVKVFDTIDTNHDKELSNSEITAAVLNPQIKGEAAAVAAALNNYMSQEQRDGRVIHITFQWLTHSAEAATTRPMRVALPPTTQATQVAATTQPTGATTQMAAAGTTRPSTRPIAAKVLLSPEGFFQRARRAIERASTKLFEAEQPEFATIRQGTLGDCYLISMLGGLTYYHPDRMGAMLAENGTGEGYNISWGDGTKTLVQPLTAAEIGVGGASMNGGIWIRVMEKALSNRKLPEDQRDLVLAANSVGRGGSVRPIIMLLSGHHAESLRLLGGKNKVTDAEIEEKAVAFRKAAVEATTAKRLMGMGTLPERVGFDLPKAVNQKHAYAVLSIDEATDMVTIWNPHANNFTPKGDPGLVNGYATKGGIFQMPTKEVVRVFASTSWETTESLKPGEINLMPQTRPTTRPAATSRPTADVR